MRTISADEIVIKIVGHDPDHVTVITAISYMRGRSRVETPEVQELRLALSRAIRQWSRDIVKEQDR